MEFIEAKQTEKFNIESAKSHQGWKDFSMEEDPMANLDGIASGDKKKYVTIKK